MTPTKRSVIMRRALFARGRTCVLAFDFVIKHHDIRSQPIPTLKLPAHYLRSPHSRAYRSRTKRLHSNL